MIAEETIDADVEQKHKKTYSEALNRLIQGNDSLIFSRKLDSEFEELALSSRNCPSSNKASLDSSVCSTPPPIGHRQNKIVLYKSKSACHSLLSQRIAIRAAFQKNAKLILTPELFRMDTEPFDLRLRRQSAGIPSFGITNSSRTQIMNDFAQYRRNRDRDDVQKNNGVTTTDQTPISKKRGSSDVGTESSESVSKHRCTPKSLFKDF